MEVVRIVATACHASASLWFCSSIRRNNPPLDSCFRSFGNKVEGPPSFSSTPAGVSRCFEEHPGVSKWCKIYTERFVSDEEISSGRRWTVFLLFIAVVWSRCRLQTQLKSASNMPNSDYFQRLKSAVNADFRSTELGNHVAEFALNSIFYFFVVE